MGEWREGDRAVARIASVADVYAAIADGADAAALRVLHLDRDSVLIGMSRFGAIGADGTLPVRAALRHAIGWRAAMLVVAHLSPEDDPSPGAAEIAATRGLADAARALGLRLVDRLLFTADDFCSFRALGLL